MSKLTDKEIKAARFSAAERTNESKPLGIHAWNELRDSYFARAIESAATAPLLQRIAELERQLEEARNNFRLIEGRAGHPEDVWVMSRKAIKAIDAAMQKGQS